MINQILRIIATGILGGIGLFILPFLLLWLILFMMIIGLIFRIFRKPLRYSYIVTQSNTNEHGYPQRYSSPVHIISDDKHLFV